MTDQEQRLSRLRQKMRAADVDGLAVSAPSNIFYLSGFRGSSGALLITEARALLFSDFRYRLQAKEQAPETEFVEVPRRLLAHLGGTAVENGVRRLGYDQDQLTCALKEQLAQGAEGVELTAAAGWVEALRVVKSAEEMDLIRAAATLADETMTFMRGLLKPGATERSIALEGEFFMRREGAEAASFDLIVASGARSALPHAETTNRELERGDMVVIDLGARIGGYCSDMTRTFVVEDASEKMRQVYRIVYAAQRAALAGVRAGAVCGDLDGIARGMIEEAGYGGHFGHGLGHGVGIEVHEAPRLGKDEKTVLAGGTVVTVEPGIYLEGEGGVRLEDLVLVGEEGAEVLTGSPLPSELPVI
ncbi:MAG: aminopeptidase P family protein [Armatimonadetes bacterium]|nr:aminopeptidase P family protein [Armatimonadota bacterium]